MKNLLLLGFLALVPFATNAQMWNGVDTLYGNEWIDYTANYFKVKITQDGVYRISYQTLDNAGVPVSTIQGSEFMLFRYGQEEALFLTASGTLGAQDYIEFYGEKNRGQVDRFLFESPDDEQVNPRYSIFNDTATYFLTWKSGATGKRYATPPNDLTNLPPKELFCWQTVEQQPAGGVFKKKISDETTYSFFDGIGYAAGTSSSETPIGFSLPKLIANPPESEANIRYAGNLGAHFKKLFINDSLYVIDSFYDYKLIDRTLTIPANKLTATTNILVTSPIGDKHSLAYATIRYPRELNFENAPVVYFELNPSPVDQYLEITAFNAAGPPPLLLDLTNNQRWLMVNDGGVLKVRITGSAVRRKFYLVNQSYVKSVDKVFPTQFENLAAPADYVIITSKKLMKDPTAGGADRVAEYAAYRASSAGGGHQVKVVNIEDLYDQFAFGTRFHPLAVRNFLFWGHKNWPQFEHVLLIGKALDFVSFRSSGQQALYIDSLFFVPNFSTPGADLPFTMQGNRLTAPIVGIGRLAVTKPQEIHDYLQKVIQHEQQLATTGQTVEEKAWMKRVIHNSGGLSGETSAIRDYTSSMANTLKNNRFGADIRSFYKTSDDPIQLSAYEQLLGLMNQGVSIWTIFGHSSAFAVDFDIGLPSSYTNNGRYPMMLVMGCFSGICSSAQKGIGEQFVLAPDHGAIGYIASVNYSYIDALHEYGNQLYSRIGGSDYGNTIGQTMAHTIADLHETGNQGLIAVLHQNLLQGDPAIKIFAHDGPDYVIDNQTVKFTPNPASVNQNDIKLTFDVVNIGENTGGRLALKADQKLPDNITTLNRLLDTVDAPAFRSSLEYHLGLSGSKIGFNRFFVQLDPENKVTEHPTAAETNNAMVDASGAEGQDVYLYSDDVTPIFPVRYGIVSKPDVTLFASTENASAPVQGYLFEMDTLETFSSPAKLSTNVTQRGGLLLWQPPIALKDSTVYYWRVARDSLVNGAPLWRSRSFIYLAGSSPGWNQSNFGQYKEDSLVNLTAVDTTRKISFEDNAAFVNVQVAFRNVNRYPGFKNAYYQGFYGDYGWNQQGVIRGTSMMVVNPNNGRALLNPMNGPYSFEPQKDREFFWFDTRDSLQRQRMMDFVENVIPDGYYVGLLAFNTPTDAEGYAPQRWALDSVSQGRNLFQVLEHQGAKEVRQLVNFTVAPPAYGFVFQKGHPEYPSRDTIVTSKDETQEVRASFLAKWALGFMETQPIGPVKAWKSLHWEHSSFDDTSDEANLSVLAVREGLEDTLLFTLNNLFDTTLEHINAGEFPYLKLRYDLMDTLTRTATPLRFARILYEGIPEGAVNPAAHLTFYQDTLQQGDSFRSSIAFSNISDAPFDSLLVRLKIDNQLNNGFELTKKLRPLAPGDTLHADFSAPTRYLEGKQRLIIEANPANNQPELFHFNNLLLRDFFVAKDNLNPLLDVTFDGQHIMDGDLISPKPEIVVTLKDENRFLAMRDTHEIKLTLVYPDGSQKVIPSNDPDLVFFPADPTNLPKKNLARLEWRPTFLSDGLYRLLVNGNDASGNESSDNDWSVTFNIITKSSLSNILNYPNPFSTSTCFVYTLTGYESPAHFKIQIMTVAGRVVREITEQEFGPLKPGVHRSEFCWDGRDEYGDQLANGVYLYRIVAKKSDGTDFELFDRQSIDGLFKHGFGKMVIMR